jgi:hypothetical protein
MRSQPQHDGWPQSGRRGWGEAFSMIDLELGLSCDNGASRLLQDKAAWGGLESAWCSMVLHGCVRISAGSKGLREQLGTMFS